MTYRAYKNFSNEIFQSVFLSTMERYSNISFADKNFMDKQLNQAMMVRSKLRNKFLKLRTEENRLTYVKQRNYGIKLLQEKKQQYFKT